MRQPKCRTCGEPHALGHCPQSVGRADRARSRLHRPGSTPVPVVTVTRSAAVVDRQAAKDLKASRRVDRPKPATLNDVVREIAALVRDDGQPEPERLPFTDSDVNALDPVECFLASPAGRTIPPEVRKVITDHLAERAERRKYMREYQRGRRKAKKRKAKR